MARLAWRRWGNPLRLPNLASDQPRALAFVAYLAPERRGGDRLGRILYRAYKCTDPSA